MGALAYKETSEYQYLINNKSKLNELVHKQKEKYLTKGYNLDEERFLKDLFRNVRDKEVDISQPIEVLYSDHESKTVDKYVTKNETVEPILYVQKSVSKHIKKEPYRKVILDRYGKELVRDFGNYQSRLGTKTAMRKIDERIKYEYRTLLAEQEIKQGKLSKEDLRRLNRMSVEIKNNKEKLASMGYTFSTNIDGTRSSHIRMKYNHNGKELQFFISPSQIVNHSLKQTVYKRENVGSTVTEFKENVPKLVKMGIPRQALQPFVLLVATSFDLRKRVIDNETGKNH